MNNEVRHLVEESPKQYVQDTMWLPLTAYQQKCKMKRGEECKDLENPHIGYNFRREGLGIPTEHR